MNKTYNLGILIFGLFLSGYCQGQVDSVEIKYQEQYKQNIKMSRINGVYIPKDLADAFNELNNLSDEESLSKFKSEEEFSVSKKIHFGLGRWMIYNWNFYEGSRFSHNLKEKGLQHPDDMAQFIIICYHRNLNSSDLQEESLIEKLNAARKAYLDEYDILHVPGIKRDTIRSGG